MPPTNLTEGAIAILLSGGDAQGIDMKPVLQVADIRLINPQNLQDKRERYSILLSDGAFIHQGMLAIQCNDLVRSDKLQKGSIVQLTQFVSTPISGRMIIIVIELDVIVQKNDPIGEPKLFPAKTDGNASSKTDWNASSKTDGNASSVPISSSPTEPHRRSEEFSKKKKEASSRFVEEVIKKNAIKQQKLQLKMEAEKMKLQAQEKIEQMRIEAMREQEHKRFEKDMMMMDPNSAPTDEGKIWIIEQQREILSRARKNNYGA